MYSVYIYKRCSALGSKFLDLYFPSNYAMITLSSLSNNCLVHYPLIIYIYIHIEVFTYLKQKRSQYINLIICISIYIYDNWRKMCHILLHRNIRKWKFRSSFKHVIKLLKVLMSIHINRTINYVFNS